MRPEAFNYDALLESLADGAALDWAALDAAGTTSDQKRRYGNLRLVARVAELHRTLVLEDRGIAAPVSSPPGDAVTADPKTWGHLAVHGRLATGSFGQVFRAHDPQLNREVALKLLRGDITAFRPVERLLSEARTLAKVHHPNVVTVYGADVRDGVAGLWMELVDGQTLESWLRVNGPLGAGEASAVGIDLCRALAAVHAAGLVHGDVKAQNVMRENRGRTVLMDFGAGRAQDADPTGVAGTPMYLAPEVLAGEPPTAHSDLYGLGVLLFHLVTAAYPYRADDLDGLRIAHADGARVWLRDLRPDLPDPLVRAIERAIDEDPARRFATAGQMERALAHALQPAAVLESPRPIRSRRLGFALGAFALAIVVGLIVWSGRAGNGGSPGIRSIAVLPMKDLSGGSAPTYLADGLHDQLITTLGQIQSIRVMSRTSVMKFRDSSDAATEIGRRLGVDAVLESTVLSSAGSGASPGRVRVNASLMLAGVQTPLWTRTFERPMGDLLALEADVARAIASGVRASITPVESVRLSRPQQTNPAAEDAYLQGRTFLTGYGTAPARRALESFERALTVEPDHAGAHAGAAYAYIMLAADGAISHQKARAIALTHARRAVEVNDDSAEAHATMADIEFLYNWNLPAAEQEYRKSLDLNPSLSTARSHYAQVLAAAGRFDESLAQAVEVESVDADGMSSFKGLILYYKRDYQAAEKAIRAELLRSPGAVGLQLQLGRVLEAEGRLKEALEITRIAQQAAGAASVPVRAQLIRLESLNRRPGIARAELADLQGAAAAGQLHVQPIYLAHIRLAFGDREGALADFARSFEDHDPNLIWLGVDPRVDSLRQDPRFIELLKQLHLS
jgi:serine/threonine protein kinase/tetratricopeptide (TPR) repeat protein